MGNYQGYDVRLLLDLKLPAISAFLPTDKMNDMDCHKLILP